MTEETKEPGTAVISLEEQLKARLALQSSTLSEMAGGQNLISFKGGQIIIDNQVVPGGTMDVTVLGVLNERTYYEGEYDPNTPQTPACYSYNGQLPHPEATQPASANCRGCPHDAWGSARRGKGKACREGARLALVSANAPLSSAPVYIAKVPITSLSTVKDFVSRCAAAGKLTAQFTAKLTVTPDPKTFFKVTLLPLAENQEPLDVVIARMEHAEKILNQPYPVFETAEEEPKQRSKKY